MKKFIYPLFIAGVVAGLSSCASDDPYMSGSTGKLSVTVELPSFETRAVGDTINCNELIYTIYKANGDSLFSDVTIPAFNGSNTTTVDMELVPGESYMIAFYAHNNASTFSTYSNGKITVDYANLSVNEEKDDAFYCYKQINFDGTAQSASLTRAFAQINFGTSDFNSPALKDIISQFSGTLTIDGGLYTTLDARTNQVSNAAGANATLDVSNEFVKNENYAVPGYGNLTSAYLLVGGGNADGSNPMLSSGSYVIKNGETEVRNIPLASTPVRMNFRTNIYGKMLTSTLPVTVEIKPAFADTINIALWDGVTATQPAIDDTKKTVALNNASDIAGFVNMIAEEPTKYVDYDIALNGDFDMQGHTLPALFQADRISNSENNMSIKGYSGTFDGQGHTIRNFTVTIPAKYDEDDCFGFISAINGGTLKNLTLENGSVSAPESSTVGIAAGILTNNGVITNVTIKGGTASGFTGTGGVVGRILGSGTVSNCTNSATVKVGNFNCGGIAGAAYRPTAAGSLKITNCNNTGNIYGGMAVGGIVGLSLADVSECNNSGDIIYIPAQYDYAHGGIVGEQRNYGTIEHCTNTGAIGVESDVEQTKCTDIAGIVGNFRYLHDGTVYGPMAIKNCTNKGSVYGYSKVGGIAGCAWYTCDISGNINEAPAIAANPTASFSESAQNWTTSCAAGIVGLLIWRQQTSEENNVLVGNDLNKFIETPNLNVITITGNTSTTTNITGGLTNPIFNNPISKYSLTGFTNKLVVSGNNPDQTEE